MFAGRSLIIATKHKKEQVIAPILQRELGVNCFIDEGFDTDILGTFTGEVERTLDPVATARKKCLLAMKRNKCDLGVASEGSFGAHPSLFFTNSDDEVLIFIDKVNKLEIIARELSLATNFNGQAIRSEQELLDFADSVQFPTHGIILSSSEEDQKNLIKGITSLVHLKEAYNALAANHTTIYAETDMRAMYNPTRMKVIESAARKLVEKINSTCPQCGIPGFCVTSVKTGLPCRLCGSPTRSTLSQTSKCEHCTFTNETMYPNAKKNEDPMYCDNCNP